MGLAELFDGRRQLVIYHVRSGPGQHHYCVGLGSIVGLGSFVGNVADPGQRRARDTELILMGRTSP